MIRWLTVVAALLAVTPARAAYVDFSAMSGEFFKGVVFGIVVGAALMFWLIRRLDENDRL